MNCKKANRIFNKNINNQKSNYKVYKMIYIIKKKKYKKFNKRIKFQLNNNKMKFLNSIKKLFKFKRNQIKVERSKWK